MPLEQLVQFQQQNMSCYLLDIRTEGEFMVGHLKGTRHVPGGQLLQATDQHLVVHNAPVVLIDSDGVRAPAMALWLRRMGWLNVYVTTMNPNDKNLAVGVVEDDIGYSNADVISVQEAHHLIAKGTAVMCDVRSSVAYRRGHAEGCYFLTRANLVKDVKRLPEKNHIILMADDLPYARLIATDLHQLGYVVSNVNGGFADWVDAEYAVSLGVENMASRPDDRHLDAYDFDDASVCDRENHQYLNWEIALVDQILGEPTGFNLAPA